MARELTALIDQRCKSRDDRLGQWQSSRQRQPKWDAPLCAIGLMPRQSTPDALTGTVRTFATALRTGYEPEAEYPAPVRLVLVPDTRLDDETNQKQFADTVRDWRTWAPDLDVWHGPGNHMAVLKAPHVGALADWLGAKLHAGGCKLNR